MVARTISVVQMLPELQAGGVERGTLELSRFLVQQGHVSFVISQGGALVDRLRQEGGRHIRLPYIGEKSPRCLLHWWFLRRFFSQSRIDVVHLRSRLPAWVGYWAWKSVPARHRPRLVTTFHGFYSVNAYSAIMTRGEKVIAISQAVSDHLRKRYRLPASKIAVIYRGIDAEQFHPARTGPERIRRIQEKWGCADDAFLILLPGRVTYWKGHDVFLQALALIRDMPWRAVCVGTFDPHSAHYKKMRQMLDELDLADRVQFPGHEDDMPAAYAASGLVISAATGEPEAFGRVSIEAQAMARPIIASAHGGSLETVIPGQTGWLFKPGDIHGLAGVMRIALSRPDLCRQYGDSGFRRVHRHFTTRQMCQSTLDLYQKLLAQ
jgi:glycosyltransferase involved in cell wall biosynthesis